MKGIVLVDKKTIATRDLPEPSSISDDEILVRMDSFSLCATDILVFDGLVKTKNLPIPIGHEGSGIVREVGSIVKNVRKGDRVLIDPNSYDLTCPACREGNTHLCANGGLAGREIDGVFQETLKVPSRNVYRLPGAIQADVAPLVQPFSTAVHAHSQVGGEPGATVVILGLGAMGLMLAQISKSSGSRVLVFSRKPARTELALKLGMDLGTNDEERLEQTVMSETGGKGADVVIECTGYPKRFEQGMHLLKSRGTMVAFGTSRQVAPYDIYEAYHKEALVVAPRSSRPRDFEEAINLVTRDRIKLDYLISKRFVFEEAYDAMNAFRDRDSVLKVILRS